MKPVAILLIIAALLVPAPALAGEKVLPQELRLKITVPFDPATLANPDERGRIYEGITNIFLHIYPQCTAVLFERRDYLDVAVITVRCIGIWRDSI